MQLPQADEPLTLADGTVIGPDGRALKNHTPKFTVVPSPSEAQRLVARTRKTVADLPLPPSQLSGVALVAFYTLFGLTDQQISLALDAKLTVEQIERIRTIDAYTEFMAQAKENILHTETETVRDVFTQHAKDAATKVVELAASENDVLAFKASQDILDRAGHRPADIVEHRHSMMDSLNIVITKRDETQEVPMIDVTPENIDG
jgi:hypothetical protein